MKKILTLLAVLALALTLLTGCGWQEDASPSTEPVQTEAPTEPDTQPEAEKETETPTETQESETYEPTDEETAEPQPEETTQPETEAPTEPEPAAEPETEPTTEPEPEETAPEDGAYTANVTLEGGTGRATVESPAKLRCEGGRFYATIVWSSPNFDYMKVDGEKYLQTNTEGNSTFEIPVPAFDQKVDVIADTVAMSEPHEVEYTLIFDSASLTKQ